MWEQIDVDAPIQYTSLNQNQMFHFNLSSDVVLVVHKFIGEWCLCLSKQKYTDMVITHHGVSITQVGLC